jgi:hypothetical protein
MKNDVFKRAIDLIVTDIESVSHEGLTREVIDITHDGIWYAKLRLEDLSDGNGKEISIKESPNDYKKWHRRLLIKLESIFGPEKYPYKNDNTNWYFDQVDVTYSTFFIVFEFDGDSITRYLRNKTLDDLLG